MISNLCERQVCGPAACSFPTTRSALSICCCHNWNRVSLMRGTAFVCRHCSSRLICYSVCVVFPGRQKLKTRQMKLLRPAAASKRHSSKCSELIGGLGFLQPSSSCDKTRAYLCARRPLTLGRHLCTTRPVLPAKFFLLCLTYSWAAHSRPMILSSATWQDAHSASWCASWAKRFSVRQCRSSASVRCMHPPRRLALVCVVPLRTFWRMRPRRNLKTMKTHLLVSCDMRWAMRRRMCVPQQLMRSTRCRLTWVAMRSTPPFLPCSKRWTTSAPRLRSRRSGKLCAHNLRLSFPSSCRRSLMSRCLTHMRRRWSPCCLFQAPHLRSR